MSVLGTRWIPPGDGIEIDVALDTKTKPDVTVVNYALEAETPDGYLVAGLFSILRPPPVPTKENAIPVVDRVFMAKILAAREILKNEFVTDEEILRLERGGQLENLIIPASDPGEVNQVPMVEPPGGRTHPMMEDSRRSAVLRTNGSAYPARTDTSSSPVPHEEPYRSARQLEHTDSLDEP
jgi:hypothetical protein